MFSYHSSVKTMRGFTLIELLVVISIIGILATVVLAALSNSRNKGKDAAVIAELKQFEALLALEYDDSKTYANLQTVNGAGGWITQSTGASTSCAINFAGNYAVKARDICSSIIKNAPSSISGKFYADTASDQDQKYSIMAPLSNGTYYCIGSSGKSSTETGANNPTAWDDLGCYSNP